MRTQSDRAKGSIPLLDWPQSQRSDCIPAEPYSGSEGEMLKNAFPQSSLPCVVEILLLWPSACELRPQTETLRSYELQSQTFDVRR